MHHVYAFIELVSTLILCYISIVQQWPGLGETDVFYSWVATSFSLGALVISVIAGQMPKLIGYRVSVTIACLCLSGGGLLYSLATNGWMVLAARFLMGMFDGCAYVFTYSYISEVSCHNVSQLREWRGEKANIENCDEDSSRRSYTSKNSFKDKLFAANLLIKSAMYPITFGKDFQTFHLTRNEIC